jgi:uncharacterized membrane protein (UPF0127 family)
MYNIDGVDFDNFKVTKVTLNLENCRMTLDVVFIKGENRVVRIKEFSTETNCDVDINQEIEKLKERLNVQSIS